MKGQTFEQRFWEKVDLRDKGECWNWKASLKGGGYGQIVKDYKIVSAHRASYEMHYGVIPEGLHVCHKCDNRRCVNPNHLFLDTHQGNIADMRKKGRQTKGVNKWSSKLTENEVKEIRNKYKTGDYKQIDLALEYNVSFQSINFIVNNKIWIHVI